MELLKAGLIASFVFLLLHIVYYGWLTINFKLRITNQEDSLQIILAYRLNSSRGKAIHEGSLESSAVSPNHKVIPTGKNVTSFSANVLIYNRVPKCGSTTLGKAIEVLARKQHYQYWPAKVFFHRYLTNDQQHELLTNVYNMSLTSPICYNRHMYFFNSIGNDNGKIAWINLIRDPVERIISQFYYLRVYNKDREKQVLRWGIDPKLWFKMDLNECVKKGDPLCRYKAGDYQELQLSYFCGHMKMCREVGNQYALQQAKYNVEKHYSVVGIMENMNLFFKILQHYLPRFFKDISEVGKIKLNKHLGKSKSKVSNETKIILRNRLSEDYELYEFIQQRLQLQAKRIDDKRFLS